MAADELSIRLTAQDDLTGKLKTTKAEVERLKRELIEANRAVADTGAPEAVREYERLRAELGRTQTAYSKMQREAKDNGKAIADLTTHTTKFERAGAKLNGFLSTTAGKLATATLGMVAFGQAVQYMKDAVKAAADAEQSQKRLADAIRGSGGSVAAWQAYNSELSRTTGFDDDLIADAEVILSRFDLTTEQMRKATEVAIDFAAATGRDVPQAAEDVGKALLGNTRALKEVGINYKMTGDQAKDVTAILELMDSKVGGLASENTGVNNLRRLETTLGDIQESGMGLLPLLDDLNDWLDKTWPKVEKVAGALTLLATATEQLSEAADGVEMSGMPDWLSGLAESIWDATTAIFNPLGLLPGIRAIPTYTGMAADKTDFFDQKLKALAGDAPAAAEGVNALASANERAAASADLLNSALDTVDKTIARNQAMRAYEAALAAYVKDPSQETGEAVESAMTRAARAMDNPTKRAKFVKTAITDIRDTTAKSDLPSQVKRKLTDPLSKAENKANGVLTAVNGLKAFVPDPIDFKITVNGQAVNSLADLAALRYGTRAAGGPVTTDRPWLVGELGPELFVPRVGPIKVLGADGPEFGRFSTPGFVIPNHALPSVAAPPNVRVDVASPSAVESGPTVNIGTIQAAEGVDVEARVLHALLRADRIKDQIKRERG